MRCPSSCRLLQRSRFTRHRRGHFRGSEGWRRKLIWCRSRGRERNLGFDWGGGGSGSSDGEGQEAGLASAGLSGSMTTGSGVSAWVHLWRMGLNKTFKLQIGERSQARHSYACRVQTGAWSLARHSFRVCAVQDEKAPRGPGSHLCFCFLGADAALHDGLELGEHRLAGPLLADDHAQANTGE